MLSDQYYSASDRPLQFLVADHELAGERGLMAAYRLVHKIWEPSSST